MTSIWSRRISNAIRYRDEWQSRYKCKRLEDYYRGFQWKGKNTLQAVEYNPYTINLVYSTIKIKLASLLFSKPSYVVNPTPGNSDWNLEFAVKSAQIKQDVLNTIIRNPRLNFKKHTKLCAMDSFFRFGMMEIGYAADWRNPMKAPIQLKSHDDWDVSEEKDKVVEDLPVPINERFYIKRIRASKFLVSVSEATDLADQEWCGYSEHYYTRQLKRMQGIKWPKDVSSSGTAIDYLGPSARLYDASGNVVNMSSLMSDGSVSKVWHLWDMVTHERLLYLDNHWDEPLWSDSFEHLPLLDLRWDDELDGFYPIPPVFQWLSPQDEINEAREQTRSYRRRFTRKFQALKGTVDEEEKEKFASGPDGIIIEVKQQDAISPIGNPEQGPTAENALLLAKDDFLLISGTSAEMHRQSTSRQTATSARIADARSQIRESAEQLEFSEFISLLGRELLVTAQQRLVDGLWVRYTADPSEGVATDMAYNRPVFEYIKAQQIDDGYDFEIDVDITNATPAAMQAQREAFISFVSMIQNFPMLAMSPILIREAAYRFGYRNERVIQQVQQTALLSMAAKASMAANADNVGVSVNTGAGGGSNVAKEQIAQQTPPDQEMIDNQINQQLM